MQKMLENFFHKIIFKGSGLMTQKLWTLTDNPDN